LNGEKNDADLALRFDLTVPLARYIAQYEGEIKFPFKRHHIDRSWRGERAQTGREREFYQADIDIIGREKLPLFADVEVIQAIYQTLKNLNF
jgi:histidyl-tRNA synthetase